MKRSILIIILSVICTVALLAGCAVQTDSDDGNRVSGSNSGYEGNPVEEPPQPHDEIISIGTGSTLIVLEITDNSGRTGTWHIHTDETTLGAALLENDIIQGKMSEFGIMITHVNGLRADYNEDSAYWAFLIDGEYAMVGVDMTDIEQGRVYALIYTEA